MCGTPTLFEWNTNLTTTIIYYIRLEGTVEYGYDLNSVHIGKFCFLTSSTKQYCEQKNLQGTRYILVMEKPGTLLEVVINFISQARKVMEFN